MKPRLDLRGHRFGRLVALERILPVPPSKTHKWKCICDCGNESIVCLGRLRSGLTQSCGCLQKERASQANRTHGHTLNCTETPTHKTWSAMRSRCLNEAHPRFKYYGGRGIKVCKRWDKFENFLKDMGVRPEGLTLDRTNNNGNYCKSNCRWATQKEQCNNRRSSVMLTYQGKTQTLVQWSAELKMNYDALRARLKRGRDVDDVLGTPIKERRKNE